MYELTLNTLLKYLETIHILRQQRTGWVGGWDEKIVSYTDVQYCVFADSKS